MQKKKESFGLVEKFYNLAKNLKIRTMKNTLKNTQEIEDLIMWMSGTGYGLSDENETWMFNQLRKVGLRINFEDLGLDLELVEEWTDEQIQTLRDELEEYQVAACDDQFFAEVGHDMGDDY